MLFRGPYWSLPSWSVIPTSTKTKQLASRSESGKLPSERGIFFVVTQHSVRNFVTTAYRLKRSVRGEQHHEQFVTRARYWRGNCSPFLVVVITAKNIGGVAPASMNDPKL